MIPSQHFGDRRPTGFTLVELLIVIGIIALLVGLLLPAVSKVRVASQKVVTQGTLNRIAAACDQYFAVFGSYPGMEYESHLYYKSSPTAGDGGLDTSVVPSEQISFINYPSGTPTAASTLTSTENLSLSILGGLRRTTTNTYAYDFTAVGQGPFNLNPNKPGRLQISIEVKPEELTTIYQNPLSTMASPGQWTSSDTAVPEILDGFANPKPILYMRANRGNTGFIATGADGSSSALTLAPVPQYDTRQLYAYGFPQSGDMNYQDYLNANPADASSGLAAGDQSYFGNHELSRPGPSANPTQNFVVRGKDRYMLISAGPDGKYGTADDIRN